MKMYRREGKCDSINERTFLENQKQWEGMGRETEVITIAAVFAALLLRFVRVSMIFFF